MIDNDKITYEILTHYLHGALPISATFYGMVPKGFAMTDILREMNTKLKSILPVGIFCCATLVDINFRKQQIRIWNGGLPECFLYHSDTLTYTPLVSRHLPLGVLSDREFADDCLTYPMARRERLYIWSDGIHEARNPQDEMFGEKRLQEVFENNTQPDKLYDEILDRVQGFVGQIGRAHV